MIDKDREMEDMLFETVELENPIDMIVGVYGIMKYAKNKKPTL